MSEWQVAGVVVAMVAFVLSVGAPILKLNASITRLTVTLETMGSEMVKLRSDVDEMARTQKAELESLAEKTSAGRRRLWQRSEEQDKKLANHEHRILSMEKDLHREN